ncbi:MAG: carbohydrate-binding family 9-like protein [Pyrinomonadaceae bacterium]
MSSNATIEVVYTTIDLSAGLMDHAEWNRARPIQITRYWSGAEAEAGRHCEARILWSDDSLGVRFVCRQNEPLVVSPNPQTKKKTIGLWDRDVCEIFIAPDSHEPNRYFEFEASPAAEWIDLAIHLTAQRRETDWDFHSGMTASSRVEKHQVIIAMQIPWDDWIHKPGRGERWRANLFRCVGSEKDRGYLAWQPTRTDKPNFHVPKVFGSLVFAV